MYEVVTDIIRRIQNKDGRSLDIRPWPDAPDCVAIMAEGGENKEWFGQVELSMDADFARQVGEAIIACADEISNK